MALLKTHDARLFRIVSLPRLREPAVIRTRRPYVQIKVGQNGQWCRPMLDPHGWRGNIPLTACELSIVGAYYSTREDSYDDLCTRGCYTPGELRVAAAHAAMIEQRRAEELAELEAERERWFDEGVRKRATERRKALKKPDEEE